MAREAYPDEAFAREDPATLALVRSYHAGGIAAERARIAAWLRERGGSAAEAGDLRASNAIMALVYSLDPRPR
jgi:hypothetical protein